jgi:hypothetical protein
LGEVKAEERRSNMFEWHALDGEEATSDKGWRENTLICIVWGGRMCVLHTDLH